MIAVPSAGLDISIATNRADNSAADLANKIIDACVEGLGPVPEPSKGPAREGVFVSRRNGRVLKLQPHDGAQLMALDGGPPLPLFDYGDGTLTLPPIMAFMQQSLSIGDASVQLTDFGNQEVFDQITPKTEATLSGRCGSFGSDALRTTIEVSEEAGGQLTAIGPHGRAEYRLAPITHSIWQAVPSGPIAAFGGIVSFNLDGQSLGFTAGRARNLRFARIR
jgi:hypothetical protein